jgi:amino acid adenylation domain-containing protein
MGTPAPNDRPELTDAKLLLLQRMLSGEATGRDHPALEAIRPRPMGSTPPISPEQRNVWLHSAMAAGIPLYNESITIHRKGAFDRAVMEHAINEILRRHEAWRTSFTSADGEVVQVVHPVLAVSLPLVDISHLSPAEREAEALRIATAEARRPIDYSKPPLFRVNVLKFAEDEHRLYLTLHHIIFDGVSIYRVILPELSEIYQAFATGRIPDLPDVEVQYGDYAVWRQHQAGSKFVTRQLDYWRQTLSGVLPVLQLPTDRPRPPALSYRGSMETFTLPGELTEALKALSRREGVTLYMTLLAAFKSLLHRYSGQDDIIIGGVTDTRRRPELEHVVGYFLNSLALRTRPSGDLPFREYLRQVRDAVTGALDASDIPFDRIVRELAPSRNSGAHPLFQVLFSMEPPAPAFRHGFDLTQMDVDAGVAKFDLYLELDERPEGLIGRFFYSSDLFDAATIRRMIGHWRTMLEGVAAEPGRALARLPLMTAAERQSLVEWNDTQQPLPQLPLHQWFEAQALATPDAVAVVSNGRSCTYRELDRASAVVAHRLRRAGVQTQALVGVAVDRSIEMVASLLGVLKAGAAYLPLDPQFPKRRLQLIMDDANPRVVLTQRSLMESLPPSDAATIICDDIFLDHESDAEASQEVSTEDLAYVLYTSGSTGKPKGVEVPHGALVNLLASMQREPGFAANDRMLAVTTLSFDIAALEIFLPLVTGGQLVIATSDVAADPARLADLIHNSGCTVMQATPATWRALVDAGWSGQKRLKILCGGESLPRELADRLLTRGSSLWNLYGPTETTIWSTVHKVEAGEGPVPIGKPIANTKTFIVDEAGNAVPIGVTGELLIGSPGVARGYRNQAQLTASRFVTSPLAPGERLYRTGDFARCRADGTIECLGRLDNQVKVRGFRIEVEEIEAALTKHADVAATAVKAWPDASGERSLTAYIVARHAPMPSAAELRKFLKHSLPDYMVPSRFVALPGLPLTPNLKIDRNALSEPKDAMPARDFQEPRDNVERKLAGIWREILGVQKVGAQDNFFDLGGHSLLVAKLTRRIEIEFGRSLPMAAVFYTPQLDQLAARLNEVGRLRVIPVQPGGTRTPLFWMGGGADIRPLVDALGPDQPFFDMLLEFPERYDEIPRFEDLARAVVRTLRAQQPSGPVSLGGYCSRGTLAYEVASQLRAQGQRVDRVIMLDSTNPVHFRRQLKQHKSLPHRASILTYHAAELLRLRGRSRRRHWAMLVRAAIQRLGLRSGQSLLTAAERVIEASAMNYTPPAYDGDVALFQAARRPAVVDHRAGWRELVRGEFRGAAIPGNHEDFIQPPNVAHLATLIETGAMPARQAAAGQQMAM